MRGRFPSPAVPARAGHPRPAPVPLRGLGTALLLALLGSSCATRLPAPGGAELLGILSPEALLYVEAKGAQLETLAGRLEASLPPGETEGRRRLGQLRSLAARIGSCGLALVEAGAGGPAKEASLPPFEAAVSGNFGSFGLGLQLSASSGWKRQGPFWRNESLDLGLALPRRGLLLAAKGGVDGLVDRVGRPQPSPLAERYAPLAGSAILVWAPDPLARLGPRLGAPADLAAADLGLLGALLVLHPEAEGLPAELRFLFLDGSKAKLAMPALRLAWLFAAGRLPLAEGAPVFSRESEEIVVSGIALDPARLARLLLPRP